ncbi:MAG TPA: lantibiotic dehydratase, partial [Ktedonobacteraceae bacterium]|nr:lantibiotic dehydratase [Ktedonobacteraceae bacterium]
GQRDQRSVSLRATPVVQAVLSYAQQPLLYADLRMQLLQTFPQAMPEQIDGLLQQLWEHHLLVSDLRPPLTRAEPGQYIIERLEVIPEAQSFKQILEGVIAKAKQITVPGNGDLIPLLREMLTQQEQVAKQNQLPFQIDSALQLLSPHLNREIGQAAAQAAETLLRLSPFQQGYPHLRIYYQAFVERYGMEAEVPLLELLSPEIGLGAPPTYTEPEPTIVRSGDLPSSSTRQTRDARLCVLAAEAIHHQMDEIELDESLLAQLSQQHTNIQGSFPLALEMYMQLHASSIHALDQGDWHAVLGATYGVVGAGRTFGRFVDVLGPETTTLLQQLVKQEESLRPDALFAEVSYLPTSARAANVAIRLALRSYEIVVNVTPSVSPEYVIPLHDLVVGIRDGHFYTRSLRFQKDVIACQSHMLNVLRAPNACRFLLEVAEDRAALLVPFDWGAASTMPFLPRITQQKVVLSPAQWNLSRTTIDPEEAGSDEGRWFSNVQRWRESWRVPRYVYLVQADNRLLLDLAHPLLVAELRTEVGKLGEGEYLTLHEMLPDFGHLWLRDQQNRAFFAEIVVPMTLTRPQQAEGVAAASRPVYSRVLGVTERQEPPGQAWTYVKLYAADSRHNEIIVRSLRSVVQQLQEQGLLDRWFYIRYRDPEPHLRVRFHASEEETQHTLLLATLEWSHELIQQQVIRKVCVDTYEREIERYGGPDIINAMEEIFSADSTIVSNLLAVQDTGEISLEPLEIATFSLYHFFAHWGLNTAGQLQWLLPRVAYDAKEQDALTISRKKLCELLNPWGTAEDPLLPQRQLLLALCSPHAPTVEKVGQLVRSCADLGTLWTPEASILASLAHMHLNRLFGTDRDEEIKAMLCWKMALEGLSRRPEGKREALI